MSINSQLHLASKSTLEFKSSSFNVPALILSSNKITDIKKELQEKISQAPDFFKYSPLVIDLNQLSEQQINIDIRTLIQMLRDLKFFPIGIQGGSDKQHKIALDAGVSILSIRLLQELKQEPEVIEDSVETDKNPDVDESLTPVIITEVVHIENKIISQPVRSGQRLYSKGDLIILAQVSAGAEVLAEGNIHVYASLRGRALAGVQGDTNSRIFCSDLQAELISIAGNYRIKEDLEADMGKKSVQIFLQEQSLIIKEL
ncbi:MAG: septum site-determining protein MinC [Methylococcaceae bacterium]|nr:septum site-determining protein MinC [Methylococcaceae bacterium]